ncbi:hypothetical protein QBC35DRAFT_389783, partial [Podospora australis]
AFSDGIIPWHSSNDAVVDICSVHGLTGNRTSTWTAKREDTTPWPIKLLAPKLGDKARILSYGYDAYIVRMSVASGNGLLDHATNLLNDLVSYRDSDESEPDGPSRPLIFIAHSLGGLVCKRALLLSRNHPEKHLQSLFKSTTGIIFMGTPHRGSWMADWSRLPVASLGIVKSSNKKLIQILRTDNQLLSAVQEDFLGMVRGLREEGRAFQITCFYEELPMQGSDKVVSTESATLDPYTKMSIHANHSNMVKFNFAEDQGFKRVYGELDRWIRASSSAKKPRVLTSEQRDLLRSLPGFDLSDIVDEVTSPWMDSCQWIFAHSTFSKWLTSTDIPLLQITGQPGSGKSVLSVFIFKELRQQSRTTFYFRFGDDHLHSPANAADVWATFIRQQLQLDPNLFAQLPQKCQSKRNDQSLAGGKDEPWKQPELRRLLTHLASSFQVSTVYIIDGLDQCAGNPSEVLTPFVDIMHTTDRKSTIAVLVLNRNLARLKLSSVFQSNLSQQPIILETEKSHLKNITDFTGAKVESLCVHRPGLNAVKGAILSELGARTGSMYLLPKLIVESLEHIDSTPATIKRTLRTLPPDLETAYWKILDTISMPDYDTAFDTFLWILFSRRPLTVRELSTAIALPLSENENELQENTSLDLLGDSRLSKILPLLRTPTATSNTLKDGDTVHFVHATARQFHLSKIIKEFNPWVIRCGGMTPIHFAALGDKAACVKYLAGIREASDSRVVGGSTSLNGCNWLHLAARVGSVGVVSCVNAVGADDFDVNAVDDNGFTTALSVAAEHGRAQNIRYLLTLGASVKSTDYRGRTPLWYAVREGHTDVVRDLVAAGAVVETRVFGKLRNSSRDDIAALLKRGRHKC